MGQSTRTSPPPSAVSDPVVAVDAVDPASPRRQTRPTRSRPTLGSTRRDVIAAGVVVAAFAAFVIGTRRAITEPFWYDEQWRAYFVSVRHGWWSEIKKSNAPMSIVWYAGERLAIATRGNRESTLRFANIAWFVVAGLGAYALARRWMHAAAAVVVALVAMLNGVLVVYALQLKPFVADAAGTVLAVAALLYADQVTNVRRRVAAFGAACFGFLLATPAIFVGVPILAVLAFDGWFRRRDRTLFWGSVATVVVAGVHLRLFVLRQNALTKIDYWNAYFVPHSPGAAARFTWRETRGFVPHFVTDAYRPTSARLYPIHVTHAWTTILGVVLTALLVLGVGHAVTTRSGRLLVFGTAAAFPLTLVASWMRRWPYGFVRTNLYIVPLLYLIGALGMVRLWMLARSAVRRLRADRRTVVRWGAPFVVLACAAGLVGGVAAGAMSASVSLGAARDALPTTPPSGYGRNIGDAVVAVRTHADGGTAVVVAGTMAFRGWQYYMFQRDGLPGAIVPPERTDFVAVHGTDEPARFVATRPAVRDVYYYAPMGTSGASIHADEAVLARVHFCVRQQTPIIESGLLIHLTPCGP